MTDLSDDSFGNFGPFRPIQAQILPDDGIEIFHQPGETLFGPVAMPMRELGWAVYPQEKGGKRKPAEIDGRGIKISKYFDELPPLDVTKRWSQQAASANCAVLLGPVSGNIFVLDCDILDLELSQQVRTLAKKILGETPLQRTGMFPKIALFYRFDPAEGCPKNSAHRFADSDDAIEVLGRGKSITTHGHHYKTGGYFKWKGLPPSLVGPETAPVVTHDQLRQFFDAVHELRPFQRSSKRQGQLVRGEFSGEVQSRDGWYIPNVTSDAAIKIDGLVTDGREGWLRDLTFAFVRCNPDRIADRVGDGFQVSEEKLQEGLGVLLGYALEKMRLGGRFTRETLASEINDRLLRCIVKLIEGEITHLWNLQMRGDKAMQAGQIVIDDPVEQDFWFLPEKSKHSPVKILSMTSAISEKALERALNPDRNALKSSVRQQTETALGAFFEHVYDTEPTTKQVHVIQTPAGGGKSTGTIGYIATDPRTKQYDDLPADERPGPLLFLMPTYNNIDELRGRAELLNIDPSLRDEELKLQALDMGLVAEADLADELDRLRDEGIGAGLRTMVYKGKIAGGCHPEMAPRVQALMDAKISSAGMCRARVRDIHGEWQDEFCPFYHSCEAIKQKSKIQEQHVVFLPHAFLNLSIPEELRNVRGVIADERIFSLFVHTASFELELLKSMRKEPTLTKVEKEMGIEPQDLLEMREAAAHVVIDAFGKGDCPAKALHGWSEGKLTGQAVVDAAKRVCGSASNVNASIHPGMSDYDFNQVVTRPTGKSVMEEYRFWKIIQDRMHELETGEAPEHFQKIQLRQELGDDDLPRNLIRISWMTTPNWPAAPVLLLDASAHEEIVGRIFPDRQVVMHKIEADFNLRTIVVADHARSNRSLVISEDSTPKQRSGVVLNIERMRDQITWISAIHAAGRIVVCATMAVRQSLLLGWAAPTNVDWLHFGAERGLNFAEKHSAAIIIGRMELPTHIYDGLSCALATDEMPAILLDADGTGHGADGKGAKVPMGEQAIKLRSGRDITIPNPMHPDHWGRIVQQQFREESILQGLCRLRAVFREDTPTAYIIGTTVPESLIVDEVITEGTLRKSFKEISIILEAGRLFEGVLCPYMSGMLRSDLATTDAFIASFTALPEQLKKNYSVVAWKRPGKQHTRYAGVPGHNADPVSVFKRALVLAGIDDAYDIEVTRRAERIEPAGERPVDNVMAVTGTFEERQEFEMKSIRRGVEHLTGLSLYIPSKCRYAAGTAAMGLDRTSFLMSSLHLLFDASWMEPSHT